MHGHNLLLLAPAPEKKLKASFGKAATVGEFLPIPKECLWECLTAAVTKSAFVRD